MEQLIIRGQNLNIARDVIRAIPGYTVVKEIVDGESDIKEHEVRPGTCSSCPHFTRIEGRRSEYLLYGECGHPSMCGAKVNMYHKICSVRRAELEVINIEED